MEAVLTFVAFLINLISYFAVMLLFSYPSFYSWFIIQALSR